MFIHEYFFQEWLVFIILPLPQPRQPPLASMHGHPHVTLYCRKVSHRNEKFL